MSTVVLSQAGPVSHLERATAAVPATGSLSSSQISSETSSVPSPPPSDFYQTTRCDTPWTVPRRFQQLSRESYCARHGIVCSAVDQTSGERVLVERLDSPFDTAHSARATYRRLKLVTQLEHENLVSLVDCLSPDLSEAGFSEVYVVTKGPEQACDLGTVVRSQSLNDGHVCVLAYQILRALKYLHSAGVVHGDLKPSDFLVSEDCDVVLMDLGPGGYGEGSSSAAPNDSTPNHLDAVCFGQAADVWSVGCIMAEMVTSRALFPGRDHFDQLARIQQMVVAPHDSQPLCESRRFQEIFAGANAKAIGLLEGLLAVDQEKRLSVEDALRHSYFEQYHDPDDEPVAEEALSRCGDIPSNVKDCAAYWKERSRQLLLAWQERKSSSKHQVQPSQSMKVTMTIG